MTGNSSANSVILIVFAFSDNLSADSGIHGIHLFGYMVKRFHSLKAIQICNEAIFHTEEGGSTPFKTFPHYKRVLNTVIRGMGSGG